MSFWRVLDIALLVAIAAAVSYAIFQGGVPSWPVGWIIGALIYAVLAYRGYQLVFRRGE